MPPEKPPPLPLSIQREDPSSAPYFSGRWVGGRNDWAGEVGVRFRVQLDCEVTALGRAAEKPLLETIPVTLWSAETQAPLAMVDVGPASRVESAYAWEPLAAHVQLRAGEEYRLTQRCRPKMLDRWFDGKAVQEDLEKETWVSLAHFLGGVCRNDVGYPSREDGELRRAGMVNFKAIPSRNTAQLTPVTEAELAQRLALVAASEEESLGSTEIEARLLVLAGVLALLLEDLDIWPGTPVIAVVGPEPDFPQLVSRSPPLSPRSSLKSCSVMAGVDSTEIAAELARFTRLWGLQGGGFMLIGWRTGEVLHLGRRPYKVDSSPSVDGSPLASTDAKREPRGGLLEPAEIAAGLGQGVVIARSYTGEVTVFLPADARHQRGLKVTRAFEQPQPPKSGPVGPANANVTPAVALTDHDAILAACL